MSTPITAEYGDAKSPIEAKVGAEFVIGLPSNVGSTGYGWTFEGSSTEGVLRLLGHTYVAPKGAAEGMVGGMGQDRWTFRAEGPGQVTLTFVHARSWEPESASKTVFTVNVS
jgi:predicted secreted protein